MSFFEILVSNKVLNIVFWSWFIAQALKVIIVLLVDKKVDFKRFIGAGGMPSSHSSTVVSLATCVARINGFDSVEFAIAAVLAIIVMYDASGVRRAAGKQAKILNRIMDEWGKPNGHVDERLKELLGHTPVEVFVGASLGFALTMLFY